VTVRQRFNETLIRLADTTPLERRWRQVLNLAPELLAIPACVAVIWRAVAFTLWQANGAAISRASMRRRISVAGSFCSWAWMASFAAMVRSNLN